MSCPDRIGPFTNHPKRARNSAGCRQVWEVLAWFTNHRFPLRAARYFKAYRPANARRRGHALLESCRSLTPGSGLTPVDLARGILQVPLCQT